MHSIEMEKLTFIYGVQNEITGSNGQPERSTDESSLEDDQNPISPGNVRLIRQLQLSPLQQPG